MHKNFICFLFVLLMLSAKGFGIPVPVPTDTPVPVERIRSDNPSVLPMTGTWRFKLDHGVSPAVRGELPADLAIPDFATPAASDADWKDIPVPANWEVEGFSPLTYGERGPNASTDIGLYRRSVNVPASFAGQVVLWHFDGAYDGAEVFVNGQRCGYHESGFTAFDIDVTKAIKPGKTNLMAVRLYKKTSSSNLDRGDYWCLGGIYRDTYLVAVPQLHIDDVTVVTDLDAQYKDATLRSTVRLTGAAGAGFAISCELYALDGTKLLPVTGQSGDIGADGTATVTLAAPVVTPRLWSAEKPNLYYVFYRLSDGTKTVERVQDRIGFRKVEIKSGVFMVNGVPVKLTGTCRHEEYSPYGHALNEECWETDIRMMKAANINAVRTSHYNHAERFMELCDETGFYVLDEVPSCWVTDEIKDPSRTWAYVFRSKETLARDKNRACVVAWSCSNESGYGVNNQAEYDFMKANDPTRLAFISQRKPGVTCKTDFEDYHYPKIPELQATVASPARATIPVILTEYTAGKEAKGITDNWNIIWSTDGIAGGFIWEWQHQSLVDKFPQRWATTQPKEPKVDPKTGMRAGGGGGTWSIVTGDRKIKEPMYSTLKLAYSPIIVSAIELTTVGQCVVPIQNRYSFTNLSELTCHWQALAGEKELAKGDMHVEVKPRSTSDASFPASTGMDTLRLEFIHPDERIVYSTSLHVKN